MNKNKKENKYEEKKEGSNEDTVIYKPVKKKRKKKKHPRLKLFFKIMLITFLLLIVIGAGIFGAILYRCIWGDWAIKEKDLKISFLNSTIYDNDGNELGTLAGQENREIISKDEMSPYLFQAFISIEDERFEQHNGVDWKRTAGALLTFVTHKGESSYGGSTLTQQLVKNLTGEDDDSAFEGAMRKIKEIVRAYQVETILSKDQVLELYLNLIPLGKVYGVQMAARYYFNKNAKDLSLVESAYIAGITHAPSTYNPFGETDRTDRIKRRVKTVLMKMNELGRITEEEYNNALAEVEAGIKFEEGVITQENSLSYHSELAIKEIERDLMEKNNWTLDEAKLHLFGDGYKIYTTFDPKIQEAVDAEYIGNASKWGSKPKKVKRTREDGSTFEIEVREQSAIAIIDHKTGYVVAGTSGYGEKTVAWGDDRIATLYHSPGSSIKPLAVVGPSLEEGLITAGTVVDDSPVSFGDYKPNNDDHTYRGLINIREIITASRNVPEVKMMKNLTVKISLEYLAKFGLNTETEQNDGLALALGGMTHGPTVLQMAAAYAAIANDGTYIEPTFYTKITDQDGNTVMEKEQETRRVLSEQNAWLLQSILEGPVTGSGGAGATATGAKVKNQATAGKTGTTSKKTAVWFCGFTPYYAGAVWMGYDNETDGKPNGSGTAARLWGAVMNRVHSGLESADFDMPGGLETAVICKDSGLIATDLCREGHGEGNRAYTEYFVRGTKPSKTCDVHVKVEICNKTGKLASENCSDTTEKVFITREDSDKNTSWKSAGDAKYMKPTETCDTCKGEDKPDTNTAIDENTISDQNTTGTGNTTGKDNNTNKTDTGGNKVTGGNTIDKDNNTSKNETGGNKVTGGSTTGKDNNTNKNETGGNKVTEGDTPDKNTNTNTNTNKTEGNTTSKENGNTNTNKNNTKK